MKALSTKQPWAWLLAAGYKDIENRTWSTKFRGRFYIHTGLIPASIRTRSHAYRLLEKSIGEKEASKLRTPFVMSIIDPRHLGVIVGEADLVDVVEDSDSVWFEGPVGFRVANAVLYRVPIPWKGQLRWFNIDLPEGDYASAI